MSRARDYNPLSRLLWISLQVGTWLELIIAGKGTDADNIEMERLGALLDLESTD